MNEETLQRWKENLYLDSNGRVANSQLDVILTNQNNKVINLPGEDVPEEEDFAEEDDPPNSREA